MFFQVQRSSSSKIWTCLWLAVTYSRCMWRDLSTMKIGSLICFLYLTRAELRKCYSLPTCSKHREDESSKLLKREETTAIHYSRQLHLYIYIYTERERACIYPTSFMILLLSFFFTALINVSKLK